MKKLLSLFLSLFFATQAQAGAYSITLTTTSASVVTQETGGGVGWTNDSQCKEDDSAYGETALTPGDISEYINTRNYTGLITFPPFTTITGVMVEFRGYADVTDELMITQVYLTNLAVPGTTAQNAGKPMPDSPSWGDKGLYVGGDGDLWGITASAMMSLIQAKFFGMEFWIEDIGGTGANGFIDDSRIIIYYDVRPPIKSLLGAGL